ncbi:hypothetical protein OAN38_04460 [Candidatus Marinimicrobia bacterium]|jgi:hypothetical protein|nr:hypothetical protein [Candidatus Neomarinimicrobiota bacterium]MDC0631050.1 hypothetical protein [Candidatus Neomarinimicrobiota bacterium]
MIIEKLFSKKSKLYNNFKPFFKTLGDRIDEIGLIHLFSIWTLVVSGIVVRMHSFDRFIYWDWSESFVSLLKLLVVTYIFIKYMFPKKIWLAGNKILTNNEILNHSLLALLLIFFGYINFQIKVPSLVLIIPYLLVFVSCLMIFQFTLIFDEKKGTWDIIKWKNKNLILIISFLLMLLSVSLGIYFNDPIVSTAGMVSSPYALIALLWPNHVRHIQRARFYPLFTFAMFLCVRAPWFILPTFFLFFSLRIINYFRYGIAYPSFAVDFLDDE